MKIRKASEMGFCYGVRRAIEILKVAVREKGPVESLGAIVHNRQVEERLAREGVVTVERLAEVSGKRVAITTHGVAPDVIAEMESRHLEIIDTTCPFVRQAQKTASQLAEAGFSVIVFGDASHPEVRGVLGWASGKGLAAISPDDVSALLPAPRIGILSQTTQSAADFTAFVKETVGRLLPESSQFRIVNTICDATSKRQAAALELAREVDVMLVVGGTHSANTRHLAEICARAGVETYHIETAVELESRWFVDRATVGVTAGASTPDEAIEEVIETMGAIKGL